MIYKVETHKGITEHYQALLCGLSVLCGEKSIQYTTKNAKFAKK